MHVDIVRSIFFDISYSKLKCQTVVHNSERLLERHLEEFEGLGTGQLIRGRLNSLIFIFRNEKCLPVNSPVCTNIIQTLTNEKMKLAISDGIIILT